MEIDSNFTHLLELLHSKEDGSAAEMKQILIDSIVKKYGHARAFDNLTKKFDESKDSIKNKSSHFTHIIGKCSSQADIVQSTDSELVMTLLKDDLTCITCKGMDVSAGNQLIECHNCHALYHQDCHDPYISDLELNDPKLNWICYNCKYRPRKQAKYSSSSLKNSDADDIISSKSSDKNNSSSSSSKSRDLSNMPIKISSSSKTSSSSSGSSKSPSSSNASPLSSKISSNLQHMSGSNSSGSNSSSSMRGVVPNINIISADKRLQIMKRKAAAKIQEKRKNKNFS